MTSGADLLRLLLRERPAAVVAGDLPGFLLGARDVAARFESTADRAVASGFVADRLGFAFGAGYQASLHALVPSLPAGAIASFCVTEERGNHPRAIETRVDADGDAFAVTGGKRWSTMAPLAAVLVVVATEGPDDSGRPRLRAVRLDVGTPGLTVKEMPPPPFVPEVTHAELLLERVRVDPSAVLPGDGYADYTKPFRTVEDLHVNAALAGYLLSVALRSGWPAVIAERLVALVLSLRQIAALDAKHAETHLALAGLLTQIAAVTADAEAHWSSVADAERERWHRDRALVQVAARAREQRRERAWQDVEGKGSR